MMITFFSTVPSVQDTSLKCFDAKSLDAIVGTGLDCDSGLAPPLHHSWDVETTSALTEGLV